MRSRSKLTLQKKIKIIKTRQEYKISIVELAKLFNCGIQHISFILKNKDKIIMEWNKRKENLQTKELTEHINSIIENNIKSNETNLTAIIRKATEEYISQHKILNFNVDKWLKNTTFCFKLHDTILGCENIYEPIVMIDSESDHDQSMNESGIHNYKNAYNALSEVQKFLYDSDEKSMLIDVNKVLEALDQKLSVKAVKQTKISDYYSERK